MNDLAEMAINEIQALLDVNVRGPTVAIKFALAHMNEGGSIVTIGSYFADRVPFGSLSVYAGSKSSLAGFNQGLARELGPRRITANIVQPGSIDTDMNPAHGPFGDPIRLLTALNRYGDGLEMGMRSRIWLATRLATSPERP